MVELLDQIELDATQLPDTYDELVAVEKLVHGDHNPRRVRPTDTLKKSVAWDGLDRPLIVRPDTDREMYHITDGWQRYQAATETGWEYLPVRIYETHLQALRATETASIVREWSMYEWAQYCQSLADEIAGESNQDIVEAVAAETVHSPQTVRRYLDVLSLPVEIHPLLKDGLDGDNQAWNVLRNHNPDVRQFGDLWWTVAAQLARKQSSLAETRVIEIAANAVEFDTAADAMEFVELAASEPDSTIDVIRREVLLGSHHNQYLLVPRVPVKLSQKEKRAVMDHCHRQRQSLSDIVTESITSLASDLTDDCTEEGA